MVTMRRFSAAATLSIALVFAASTSVAALSSPVPDDGGLPLPPEVLSDPETLADLDAGVISSEVPRSGSGEYTVLDGDVEAADPDAHRVIDVQVEAEDDLDLDLEAFGNFVIETLNDERGWSSQDPVSFARTDSDPDFRVVLATPESIDENCAPLDTAGYYSCANMGVAWLNADRWTEGADAFNDAGGDLTSYRQYLVNHEVGHLLGYGHEQCPAPGQNAPVMLQQSMFMQGCEPNGWISEEG